MKAWTTTAEIPISRLKLPDSAKLRPNVASRWEFYLLESSHYKFQVLFTGFVILVNLMEYAIGEELPIYQEHFDLNEKVMNEK